MTLNLEQAADFLKLHPATLASRAKAGKIPGASKPGRRWVFRREGLDAYLNQHSPCPFTGEEGSGGSSYPRTQAQLESLLELPTGGSRRSTTRSGKARYGASKS